MLQKEDNDWVKKCMEYEGRVPDQKIDQRGLGKGCAKSLSST